MSEDAFPHYQTLEPGTEGEPGKANRSTPDRLVTYGIDKVVTKESMVLDLGCNRGYFGICLSPLIKFYVGVEASQNELKFGEAETKKRGLTNLLFVNEKYTNSSADRTYGLYDIIICCAFHMYCEVSMEVFAKNLVDMLKPKGRLFLEGHPSGYHLPHSELREPQDYWIPLTEALDGHGLKTIEGKMVKDRTNLRPFIHYQK